MDHPNQHNRHKHQHLLHPHWLGYNLCNHGPKHIPPAAEATHITSKWNHFYCEWVLDKQKEKNKRKTYYALFLCIDIKVCRVSGSKQSIVNDFRDLCGQKLTPHIWTIMCTLHEGIHNLSSVIIIKPIHTWFFFAAKPSKHECEINKILSIFLLFLTQYFCRTVKLYKSKQNESRIVSRMCCGRYVCSCSILLQIFTATAIQNEYNLLIILINSHENQWNFSMSISNGYNF